MTAESKRLPSEVEGNTRISRSEHAAHGLEECLTGVAREQSLNAPLRYCHFHPLASCVEAKAHDSTHPVFFFDLDNTLYPKSSGIAELMARRIELFFTTHLKLPLEESRVLGAKFYRDYGLAIKGMIEHFAIDPAEYDCFVDGGLPLDQILAPSPRLTQLLSRLNNRGSCWIFTNAGLSHATRVLRLLQLESLFAGVIYCDYREPNFPAKPDRMAFQRAMQCAQVADPSRCFFFDDSIDNIRTARELGWHAIYIDEDWSAVSHGGDGCANNVSVGGEVYVANVSDIGAELELSSRNATAATTEYPTVRHIEDIESLLRDRL